MELRQLKTFAAISRLGSFVQAAQTLGYAQSTITSHIQGLEKELGVRLFERLGHRVRLTRQGESLLSYAGQVLKLTDEVRKHLANPAVPQGKLTIGTSESLGTYRLPELLKAYRDTCPRVELSIKFANCDVICDQLRENEIDVGLIINNKTTESGLVCEDISREEMLFLADALHPLTRKTAVGPRHLAGTGVILTEPGCSYRLTMEKIFRDYGVVPQSILEASSIETIKQLMLLGLGVSMLPRFAVENELGAGRLCALRWDGPELDYRIQMLHHKDKWLSPALLAFMQMVRRAAAAT